MTRDVSCNGSYHLRSTYTPKHNNQSAAYGIAPAMHKPLLLQKHLLQPIYAQVKWGHGQGGLARLSRLPR